MTTSKSDASGSRYQLDPWRGAVIDAALKGLGPAVHEFEGARVLVTGARGFFGRYVVDGLLAMNSMLRKPLRVYAMDSFATGANDRRSDWLNAEYLTFIQHDVRHEMGNMHALYGEPLSHIWHLAGIASPYWYKKLPQETIDVAVEGTQNMLTMARDHGAKFLFTSSSEVYQTATTIPTPEEYVGAIPSMNDRSCYDVSKLMAETLCYVASMKHAQRVNLVRIFNSFGPGMSEEDRRILPRIASAMKAQRPLNVYRAANGSTMPRRTYTPVANTLLGFLLVAAKGTFINGIGCSGVYNVGLDKPEVTVPELISRIAQVTGREVPYSILPPPQNYETEPMRRAPQITRLQGLGFLPVMDLDAGIKVFMDWALETYQGLA